MKKILIISSLGLILTGLILVTLLTKKPTVTFHLSQPLGKNMRFATQVSTDQVDYFNGSIFIARSISKGTSSALSPVLTLPTITDVHWGANGVVFKAGNYSGVDQLFPLLQKAGLNTARTYWWLCDFKTGVITVVGSNIGSERNQFTAADDVLWNIDGVSLTYLQTVYPSTGPIQIIVQQGIGSSSVKVGQLPKNSSLVSASSKLIFVINNADKSTLQKYTTSTKQLSNLVSAYGINPAISADGTSVAYIQSTQAASEGSGFVSGDLKSMISGNEKAVSIAHDITGLIKWDRSNAWLELGPGKDILSGYTQDQTGKVSLIKVDTGKQEIDTNTMNIMSYQNDIALLLSGDNTAYLASTQVQDVKVITNDSTTLQKPIYTADFYSTYDSGRNQFTIYILKNPYQAGIAKSISYFQQAGVDPFQLNIKWYPYDGVIIN
jgi:hypothetical protein